MAETKARCWGCVAGAAAGVRIHGWFHEEAIKLVVISHQRTDSDAVAFWRLSECAC